MRTLPEICEFCKREMRDLERVVVPLTLGEKRAAPGKGDGLCGARRAREYCSSPTLQK